MRLAERQRTEDDRLHQRKDGGVRAGGERQHRDHACRKCRLAPPRADGLADVDREHACEHTEQCCSRKAHCFSRIDENCSWTWKSGICRWWRLWPRQAA
jgi:hypothetical protein